MYYYTSLIGDPLQMPTVRGTPAFFGIGLLDSDVYYSGGASWYANQVCYRPRELLYTLTHHLRTISIAKFVT